jgi:hypothetical protein
MIRVAVSMAGGSDAETRVVKQAELQSKSVSSGDR